MKPASEQQQRQFQVRANSIVLIEYDNDQEAPYDDEDDNNQEAPCGEEPKPNQQAIYRVWLEQEVHEHQWDAIADVQLDTAGMNPNQKRQDGKVCSQPVASSGATTASVTATTKGGTATSPTVSVTKSSLPSSLPINSTGTVYDLPRQQQLLPLASLHRQQQLVLLVRLHRQTLLTPHR